MTVLDSRQPHPDERGVTAKAAVSDAVASLGVPTNPSSIDEYLSIVTGAAKIEDAARAILKESIGSARQAGATWSTIGATLGMTKQAAQKRFAPDPAPTGAELGVKERILGPVTAFDELKELKLAGLYGWHSIGFGAFHHIVRHSDTQWEHRRVTTFARTAAKLQEEGWELIGSEFPFAYLKRNLGTPALVEPAAESV